MFFIVDFIKNNNIFIDGKCVNTINSRVLVGKFVYINKTMFQIIRRSLIRRIMAKRILFFTPKYLFVSYRFFFFYLYRLPKKTDLPFTINLDIQRLTGYF